MHEFHRRQGEGHIDDIQIKNYIVLVEVRDFERYGLIKLAFYLKVVFELPQRFVERNRDLSRSPFLTLTHTHRHGAVRSGIFQGELVNFVDSDMLLTLVINFLEEFARAELLWLNLGAILSCLVSYRRLQLLPKNIVVSTFPDKDVRAWDHCLCQSYRGYNHQGSKGCFPSLLYCNFHCR